MFPSPAPQLFRGLGDGVPSAGQAGDERERQREPRRKSPHPELEQHELGPGQGHGHSYGLRHGQGYGAVGAGTLSNDASAEEAAQPQQALARRRKNSTWV